MGEESDCHVVIVGSDSDGSADVSEMIHEDVKHFAIHTPSEPEMDELTKKTRGAWRIIGFGAYKGRTMPRYSDNSKRDWGDRSHSRKCRGRIWRRSQAKERGQRIVSAEVKAANGSHRYKW